MGYFELKFPNRPRKILPYHYHLYIPIIKCNTVSKGSPQNSTSNGKSMTSSIESIAKITCLSFGYFINLPILKVTSSLFTYNLSPPRSTSTNTLVIVMNCQPRILETSKSISQSRITKSTRKINLSTLICTS